MRVSGVFGACALLAPAVVCATPTMELNFADESVPYAPAQTAAPGRSAPAVPPPMGPRRPWHRYSPDGVRAVVLTHLGDVSRCAGTARSSRGAQDRIALRFVIDAAGHPMAAMTVSSTLAPAVGDCLVAAVSAWRFTPSPNLQVIVTYPFVLSAPP